MPTVLRDSFSIIKQHRRAFVALSLTFYGLVLVSMALAMYLPELQDPSGRSFHALPLEPQAANAGQVFVSSITLATLPSLLIPFAGVLVQVYRVFVWGALHAPGDALLATQISHSLALLMEGQAYVLVAFAAYVQGRMFLWPEYYRMHSHREGFKAGAVATLRIYLLIVLTLALGAMFNMLEGVDLSLLK